MDEPIAPILNELNSPFWNAGSEGRLVLPVCATTARFFWPPSPVSPFVTGGAVVWREASPLGWLTGRVVYRRVFQKAFAALMPYAVGLVSLDAGPRLQAYIPGADLEGVPRIGDRVALGFARIVEEGPAVPVIHLTAHRWLDGPPPALTPWSGGSEIPSSATQTRLAEE